MAVLGVLVLHQIGEVIHARRMQRMHVEDEDSFWGGADSFTEESSKAGLE